MSGSIPLPAGVPSKTRPGSVFSNGCTVVGGPDTAGTPSVAPATPLACRRRKVSRYAACSSGREESSTRQRASSAATCRRNPCSVSRFSSHSFVASSSWSRVAISVPGWSAAMTAWARPFGFGAIAERVEVERTGHEAAGRRVVDHAQPGGPEAPTHLDVDRVAEALVVQGVAQEQRALARDPPLPEPAPVELLAVAEAFVGEHQPVDVGDEVHERRELELGRPVGVAEDRDRLARVGPRGPRGGARDSRARRGRRRRRTRRSARARGTPRGSSPRCDPECSDPQTDDLQPVAELFEHRRELRRTREPSSTTTTSYSERSRVCSANEARHARSRSGRS